MLFATLAYFANVNLENAFCRAGQKWCGSRGQMIHRYCQRYRLSSLLQGRGATSKESIVIYYVVLVGALEQGRMCTRFDDTRERRVRLRFVLLRSRAGWSKMIRIRGTGIVWTASAKWYCKVSCNDTTNLQEGKKT